MDRHRSRAESGADHADVYCIPDLHASLSNPEPDSGDCHEHRHGYRYVYFHSDHYHYLNQHNYSDTLHPADLYANCNVDAIAAPDLYRFLDAEYYRHTFYHPLADEYVDPFAYCFPNPNTINDGYSSFS